MYRLKMTKQFWKLVWTLGKPENTPNYIAVDMDEGGSGGDGQVNEEIVMHCGADTKFIQTIAVMTSLA